MTIPTFDLYTLVLVPITIAGFKLIPSLKSINVRRNDSLDNERRADMTQLRARVDALEKKLDEQRDYYESELSRLRVEAHHAAVCLDTLIMLIDAAPDKIPQHITRIKEMRDVRYPGLESVGIASPVG
jgi:hypothetical protein